LYIELNGPMCCSAGIRFFVLELLYPILLLIIWIHWLSAVCLHERMSTTPVQLEL
jgi:hypothetical protein